MQKDELSPAPPLLGPVLVVAAVVVFAPEGFAPPELGVV